MIGNPLDIIEGLRELALEYLPPLLIIAMMWVAWALRDTRSK